MTQTADTTDVLKQLGKLTTIVESIQTNVQDIKVSQARTDECLKALETQILDIKNSTDTQFADIKKAPIPNLGISKCNSDLKIIACGRFWRYWALLQSSFSFLEGRCKRARFTRPSYS